jgi:hypothetical protein
MMYILKDRKPVACPDMVKWGRWMERADRHVGRTAVGPLDISTVFLGLDHNFFGGQPILFETMIFGFDGEDSYQTRCSTWDEAEAMHRAAVLVAEVMLERAETSLAQFRALYDAGGADRDRDDASAPP